MVCIITTDTAGLSLVQNEFSSMTINRKRNLLLQRSPKEPSKRLRRDLLLLQQQEKKCGIDDGDGAVEVDITINETTAPRRVSLKESSKDDKIERKGRQVTFADDKKKNQIILVETLSEYTESERNLLYMQQHEYDSIKLNIARTVSFLNKDKYNNNEDGTDVSTVVSVLNTDNFGMSSSIEETKEDKTVGKERQGSHQDYEHCVRGLEHIVLKFVGNYGRNVQKNSKTAVFRFQQERRQNQQQLQNEDEVSLSDEAILLAELYKKYTTGCQRVANRWGYFDAIDAGSIVSKPASSPSSRPSATTKILDMSSIKPRRSCDENDADYLINSFSTFSSSTSSSFSSSSIISHYNDEEDNSFDDMKKV